MLVRSKAALVLLLLATTAAAGCLGGKSKGNTSPNAHLTITPKGDGVTFLFDATNSTDPDGDALSVKWNFGDDGEQTGPLNEYGLIEYTYAVTDTTFTVTLIVDDGQGHADATMETVLLGKGTNAAPDIRLKNATRWIHPGGGVVLDASKSTDGDGDLFSYEWVVGNYSADVANASVFDSGELSPDNHFLQTFATVGIYEIYCQDHPWMRGRIIVSDTDPNATSDAEIHIENFAYSDKSIVVKPGTQVEFHNHDPVNHTATLDYFAPGRVVSTNPILSQKLDAGDYQARLTLNDGKGGVATRTWGLKASPDAPPNPDVRYFNKTGVSTFPSNPGPFNFPYPVNWTQNVTGSISWSDSAGAVSNTAWKIQLYNGTQLKANCFTEEGTCTFVTNVEPGTYTIRISVSGSAVSQAATATTSAIQYTRPAFGDSVGSARMSSTTM